MLTSVDGNVIGIGQLTDEEEGHHPVTFVRDGEDWSVVPLEGAPRGTWLDGVTTAGGGRSSTAGGARRRRSGRSPRKGPSRGSTSPMTPPRGDG